MVFEPNPAIPRTGAGLIPTGETFPLRFEISDLVGLEANDAFPRTFHEKLTAKKFARFLWLLRMYSEEPRVATANPMQNFDS